MNKTKKEKIMKASQESTSQKDDKQQVKHKYSTDRVVGNGTFGVVFQAYAENGDRVAIKRVLQDRRYKNRELEIMQKVKHPNVVEMVDFYYTRGKDKRHARDVFLNLVMEYMPETIHKCIRTYSRAKEFIPLLNAKLYAYQIARAVAYIHRHGICHRDIKPQNLLLDPRSHIVKMCDFGSAKALVRGEPNTAYICSRYYRAPELIFEATHYSTHIDTWSLGCVIGEIFLGEPLFQGNTSLDQLVQIIQVLGSPSKEDILAMNHSYTTFRFPQVKPLPWAEVFRHVTYSNDKTLIANADGEGGEAIDLMAKMMVFNPDARITAFEAMIHPFFDDIRESGTKLSNGKPLPPLFNWTNPEVKQAKKMGIYNKLNPEHLRKEEETAGADKSSNDTEETPTEGDVDKAVSD